MKTRRHVARAGLTLLSLFVLPLGVAAQERTLDELKQEILLRAGQNRYPITEVKVEDVRLALSRLTSKDADEWAQAWSHVAEPYEREADEHARGGRKQEALAAFYQAYRYYSLGRWPLANSPGKRDAYRKAARMYLAAARFFDPPLERAVLSIDGKEVVGYLRLPKGVMKPAVMFHWGGLDGWKEDRRLLDEAYLAAGWASFVIDLPGTGENPFLATPETDRVFSRVLDYLQTRPELDPARIAVQGSSWGGYWAAKLAHVERRRVRAAVNWGGPIHHYFQPEWQRKALQTREYLFGLFEARAALYGAGTLDAFLAAGPKLSLQALGVLGQPSAPLLSVNGKNDTQVPIADLYLLGESGSPKAFWVNPAGGHMARGGGVADVQIINTVIIPWVRPYLAAANP
jgi:pimeloyl-ACP methyl ester carboxylesterase